MAGPHRLVSAARHALAAVFADLPIGSPVLLAVSGGPDSLALAASACYAARERAIRLYSLTVDHGVRPESAAEAAAVCQQLQAWGIEADIAKVQLGVGDGPEGEARSARYAALAARAEQIGVVQNDGNRQPALVLLGHNANDQAETVLLGFGRGAGARSVSGMSFRGSLPLHAEVPMCRPLLEFTRAEIEKICAELHLHPVEDPSNKPSGPWKAADGSPLRRSALRYQAIPVLEKILGPGLVPALARTAKLLQADEEVLSGQAEKILLQLLAKLDNSPSGLDSSLPALAGKEIIFSCADLAAYPLALRRRVLRLAFLAAGGHGGELVYSHLAELDKLVLGQENKIGIDLPGVKAWRDKNSLSFTSQNK
ncbi:tRNA lysidine(34) synthetase TilS [uncultured Arcanobacterium sp.]|uniref:tRNA lysidine(34) synthetase TilS n=1 Tax=uncultured Arcanobacterium sp. TaxID=487520 RepID=UPI00260F5C50|nr:tRNA lysidine(34) synthetase TilS [uncultured Arcanobacterium sp.]